MLTPLMTTQHNTFLDLVYLLIIIVMRSVLRDPKLIVSLTSHFIIQILSLIVSGRTLSIHLACAAYGSSA